MTRAASMIFPARRSYRGAITDPERWPSWTPREGDILVCTPPKCGTTWTQAILASLLQGGRELPDKLGVLSPWVDADLGIAFEDVAAALARQTGRRVVKTHTPADGFPVWDNVTVIAVYRHPLDAFFSLRKHLANRTETVSGNLIAGPLPEAFAAFVQGSMDPQEFDKDSLETLALHFLRTAGAERPRNVKAFHYADMLRDPHRAVGAMAEAVGIAPEPALIDAVTKATAFNAMRTRAATYAPVAGTGFWKSDAGFFDAARSGSWRAQLSPEQITQYETRLASLLPDAGARQWLEMGEGGSPSPA